MEFEGAVSIILPKLLGTMVWIWIAICAAYCKYAIRTYQNQFSRTNCNSDMIFRTVSRLLKKNYTNCTFELHATVD